MSTWYEGTSSVYPSLVDTTSSKKWVYVRRNIEEHEREDDEGIKEKFYSYEEMKVPKDVYDIFRSEQDNSDRLNDIEEVLTEILGGDLQ